MCRVGTTASLQASFLQTNILQVEFAGVSPVFWVISALRDKTLIESNPSTCRISPRKTAADDDETSPDEGVARWLPCVTGNFAPEAWEAARVELQDPEEELSAEEPT